MTDSMAKYDAHAQLLGTTVLELVHELIGVPAARELYIAVPERQVIAFEFHVEDQIAEFLALNERKRGPYCRRLFKQWEPTQRVLFLVLCYLATVRVRRLFMFRDFAGLSPGDAYAATTARVYTASQKMLLHEDYRWPGDDFWSQGLGDGT